MAITREEIVSVLGPSDDALIAEIMITGASFEGCGIVSSGVSLMLIKLSSSGVCWMSAFESVVLPEPVAPEMTIFFSANTASEQGFECLQNFTLRRKCINR